MGERAFNPQMFKLGRDRMALTQADLAQSAGVTQALVSKMENGLIQEPSDDAVSKLASIMRLPPSFFYQHDKSVGLPHFHYRKRAKLGAKPLSQIEAVVNIRRQHIAKLLRSYEFEPAKPIPQIDLDNTGLSPESVAERMRDYWMLPRGPVDSVVGIIEHAGGVVVAANFGTDLLDGISFRHEGLPPLFFMNREMPADRFRFSLAHELGHMVMHAVPDDDEKMESEAHRFASAFLMPAKEIRPYLSSPKLSALGRVKAYWKVSIKALIKRAADLKLVTPNQYKSLCIQYNKVFSAGEPIPLEHERPSRLQDMIEYHRATLSYSREDLANLLCLLPDDVDRHYISERGHGLRLIVSNP